MITKNKIQYVPPVCDEDPNTDGYLAVNGDVLRITDIHLFDDFGDEHETLTLEDGSEYYTQDGGETFREN